MADDPADKPADESAGKSAGAPADSGPKPSGADDPAAAPPEVEAEIVEDGYRKPPSASSPRAEAAATQDPQGPSGDAAAGVKPAPKLALPGRPWLMVAGAATLAAIALAAWMATRGPKEAAPAALPPVSGPAQETAPASPRPAPSAEDPADAADSADSIAPAGRPASPPRPAATDKIANTGVGAAKDEAAALDPEAVDPDAAPASARGLPPPPASFGDDSARQSAKEALRALSPQHGDAVPADADPGDAIDAGPVAEDRHTEETPALGESPEESAALPAAPDAGAQKLANEVDALKSQLAEAQARNERQAAEIADLRDSFQQALIERDRRDGAALASLGERLDKIQSGSDAPRGREAAASLALVALSRAVASGAPYASELDALARVAPRLGQGGAALDALRARADAGAPTLAALKAAFPAAARAARAADRQTRARGPIAMFFARLENLVSVRPAEPMAGGGATAIVSRAEDRLDREMLDAAVAEVETLSDPAAAAFAGWLADARARLSAERALAELNRSLLADLTQ